MTCREKLAMEHPDKIKPDHGGGCVGCPHFYGYLDQDFDICTVERPNCVKCWDREIPEDDRSATETTVSEPTIKDSGDRTRFASGAVRDMRAGKGRCDLMPLEVVANYICDDNDSTDIILWGLKQFLKTNSTSYLYSALNSFDALAYADSYTMFLEVAKHYEEGALKYGESNWQKGIPTWCYIDSAIRHYLKWCRGDIDEPHDRAFVWNVLCCIWEVDYRDKEEPK